MPREYEGWRRYAVFTAGCFSCAAFCVQAVPFLIARTGVLGPTVLQAQSPVAAAIAVVLVFALATGVACVVGRFVNATVGLFALGAGLWALRYRCATIADLAFSNGSLGLVAVETALWGLLVLGAAFAMFRFGGPMRDVPDELMQGAPWYMRAGLRGLAAAFLAVPVVWLVARAPVWGQTLAAATMGGVAVGLVGRLLEPRVQPRLLFAAPCFVGAMAHTACLSFLSGTPADAIVAGTLPALCLPMPIDYAAGSLMGVAMGLGWAKSFLPGTAPQHAAHHATQGN